MKRWREPRAVRWLMMHGPMWSRMTVFGVVRRVDSWRSPDGMVPARIPPNFGPED